MTGCRRDVDAVAVRLASFAVAVAPTAAAVESCSLTLASSVAAAVASCRSSVEHPKIERF